MKILQGRGSAAAAAIVVATTLLLMVLQADASTYKVGGDNGWTFHTENWPKGKRFSVGDFLLFSYNPLFHNVVAVNRAGYVKCFTPLGAKVYRSGKDLIKLVKGANYFICSVPGHCQSGMRIAITV